MRCYHLCNMYLTGIHAGIQSAHAQMELFSKYNRFSDSVVVSDLYTWASDHKTTICLNGGYATNLEEFYNFLVVNKHDFPYSIFRESKEALNNVITNVAIVLPERIYQLIPVINLGSFSSTILLDNKDDPMLYKFVINDICDFKGELNYTYNAFEVELIKRIAGYKLMN